MALGLLKWLKETRFYKRKEKTLQSYELCIQRRKLVERRSLHDVLWNEKTIFQSSKEKKQKQRQDIFFGMEHRLLVAKEPLFWIFWGLKIRSFLSQKVDETITFIDYWKVLVLNFLGMGNTVFFEAKS